MLCSCHVFVNFIIAALLIFFFINLTNKLVRYEIKQLNFGLIFRLSYHKVVATKYFAMFYKEENFDTITFASLFIIFDVLIILELFKCVVECKRWLIHSIIERSLPCLLAKAT